MTTPPKTFRDLPDAPEMVVIPPGRFLLGSPEDEEGRDDDEGPQHEVTIGYAFAVGKFPVTFDEWDACVADGGCNGYRPDDQGWGRGNRPVINVSWNDAQAYVAWLSQKTGHAYRLLSEAEWEYAARAGTTTRFSFGNTITAAQASHNHDDKCTCEACVEVLLPEKTAPVGSFPPNAFGLHDMHGSVWEWVEDPWHAHYAGAPADGSAWTARLPDGNRVRIFDAATGHELFCLEGHTDGVTSASFSPDSQRIVTASGDSTARIWNAVTGQELIRLLGHEGEVWSCSFSPAGQRVVTASADETARIWDAITGQELFCLQGHDDSVMSAAFSPDGQRVVTASSHDNARIWDVATGRELFCLKAHTGHEVSANFSPDGQRVVTTSHDNAACIWNAATGREIVRLEGHEAAVVSAAFSPDGQHVVTSSDDHTVRVWSTGTGKERLCLNGHTDAVLSAAFSPDGQHIMTASHDDTVRIWDATTGQERLCLNQHPDAVMCAAFSPDGLRIVSGFARHDRIIRGGSWADISEVARSAMRTASPPTSRYSNYGFRVARSL
jgi:WD40 repeat protein